MGTARRSPDRTVAALLSLVAFIAYALTAAPSIATVFDDSLEFQVVVPTLGIAHPSGYPLYTLAGKLFTLLVPFRDPAGALNLFSAFCAAVAVAVLFMVARRLAGSTAAALTAVTVFAISPTWWSQATLAEVYALHGLLVVLFLYFLLRWEEDRLTGRSDRFLRFAALTCGLGLAHHRMIALLLPAALVFIFWADPKLLRTPRRWLAPVACGLGPLLLYLYLPLRGQAVTSLDGTYQPTLLGTLDWILARGYSIFITGNPFNVDRGFGHFLALFLAELSVLVLVAALIGAWKAWDFSRRRAVFLLLATLAQLGFAATYKVEDIEVFLIPAFMLVTLWAAWGLAPFFDNFAIQAANVVRALHVRPVLRRPLYTLWLAALASVVLFEPGRAFLASLPQRDRSDDWAVYDQASEMIEAAAPDGRVVGLIGETTLVRYFRDVLGQHPQVEVWLADAEGDRYAGIEASLSAGKSVFLTRDLPGAAQRYSLDAAGPLIRVQPKAAPGPGQPGVEMGAGVRLLSAQVDRPERSGLSALRVTLTWTAAQQVREPLKVSVRSLGQDGQQLVAVDAEPVHFAYPTTAWMPGELVDDVYELPGDRVSQVLIILYRASDGAELGRHTLQVGT